VPATAASGACPPGSLPETYATIIADFPAPSLGVVIDKNMNVLSVDAYSIAERAGVRAGDMLVWIEDVPFSGNREQVKALIAGARPGQALRLRLLRGGQPIELQVVPAPVPPPVYPTIDPNQPPPPTSTPVPPTYDYL
jgi:S1-C subfamily serine protease